MMPFLSNFLKLATKTSPAANRARQLNRCNSTSPKRPGTLADLAVSGAQVTVLAKLTFRDSGLQTP
jgi:hypothetical protein